MHRRDWSLVFLTILSQASIGMVLCLTGLVHFSGEGGSRAEILLLLALILIGVATASSFFHLGNPANAPKALRNLAGSWLSREILAIGIFVIALIAALVSARAGGGSVIFRILLLVASVAGLLLLLAMTRVYLIPTIPTWDNWYTPVSFITTTLCLGLMGFLLLMDIESTCVHFLNGVLLVILLVELLSGFLNHRRLTGVDTGFDGPTFNRGTIYQLYLVRMVILLITCSAILVFLLQDISPAETGQTWMYLVGGLVVIQEFAGRLLFYASYFRVGL